MDKKGVAPEGTEVKVMPKCAEGMVFCPMKKKCIPEAEMKSQGQGKGKARGQGKGPMGVPTKEADQLVDDILDGNYEKVKVIEQATDMVDVILDMCGKDHGKKKKAVKEVVNAIDHVPDEDADEETQKLKDEIGKEEKYRQELKRVSNPEMKKKVADAKVKCAKIKDKKERSQCIFKHIRESVLEDNTKTLIAKAYDKVITEKAATAITETELEK